MGMNINISDLCVEVTRRCPMSCTHCLRGEGQGVDLNLMNFERWISSIHKEYDLSIGEITLSGGEPLHGEGLENVIGVLRVLKDYGVEVQNFYIATSGFDLSRKAFLACADWYSYCTDNENSQVNLSNDAYHDDSMLDKEGIRLFKGLSFFSNRFREDGVEYLLVAQGRAVANYQPRQMKPYDQTPDSYVLNYWDESVGISDGTLYYNVNDALIRGCDWSYDTQDNDKSVRLCYAEDFIKIVKKLQKKGTDKW